MRSCFVIATLLLLASCFGGDSESNTAPTFSSSVITVPENSTSLGALPVTDPDGDELTFALSGEDAALFTLNGNQLSFAESPNFERPGDIDEDNSYELTVTASDASSQTVGTLTVNVTDVDELPEGFSSFQVTTTANSTRLADFTTDEDMAYTVMGQRNDVGETTAIDAVSVQNLTSDDERLSGTSVQILTDDTGRLQDFFFETGDRVSFTYRADGRVSAISVIEGETGEQEIVVVSYDDDGVMTLPNLKQSSGLSSTGSNPVRNGGLEIVSQDVDEHCELLGMKTGQQAAKSAQALSAQATTNNTTTVTTTVSECGNPIVGARVFLVRAEGSLAPTYLGRDNGDGTYTSTVPIASDAAAADFEDTCLAVLDVINTTCSAFNDASNPAVLGGVLSSCLRFINPKVVLACQAAATISIGYCQFGAPIVGAVSEGLCETARENLDFLADDLVPFYAQVYLPSGGRAQSAVQSARRSGPIPDFFIDTGNILGPALIAFTDPGDPSPSQGYLVSVAVSCRAVADQVVISVRGTDGFEDSETCQLTNGQGGCTLSVPGAAAGVVDTITINAGSESKTLSVVF